MKKLLMYVVVAAVASATPAAAQDVMTIINDRVGIGQENPTGDIHVENVDGVGDTVFKLVSATGNWNLGVRAANGVFTFNKVGTPQEFTVREVDHAVATLDVAGHVQGTSFKSTSSRELKTGFAAVDASAVLAKVTELPITAWRYRSEAESVSHIGPVAEDFQRLFGLGDGRTITGVDADGIALVAIQGLNSKLAASEAEVHALKQANATLEARLAAIEARLGHD